MRNLILLVALFFTLSKQGFSQNATKKEKIKSLFVLMHQDTLMIKTIDAMTTSLVKNMATLFKDSSYSNLGIDKNKLMQKFMERTMRKSKENAIKLLNEDMVDIYDKYFTMEEIDDFNAFYKSKSGQKMLSQMPEITKDIMNVMTTKYYSDFQDSIMKDIQEITNELTEEMKVKQK